MEFIQHYLPGKPIEKNGQKSTGLTIKLSEIEINDNFFEIGSQVEIAFINLDQFQPDILNSPNAFNNAVRPQGYHYDFEVVTIFLLVLYLMKYKFKNKYNFFSNLRLEYLNYNYDNLMSDGRLKDDGTACARGGVFLF